MAEKRTTKQNAKPVQPTKTITKAVAAATKPVKASGTATGKPAKATTVSVNKAQSIKAKAKPSGSPTASESVKSKAKPNGSATAQKSRANGNTAVTKQDVPIAKGKAGAKPAGKLLPTAVRKVTAPVAGKKKLNEIDDKFVKAAQQDINTMMTKLCQTYPDAECELDFKTTFQLLTAVIMSAQTTDGNVNKVTPILFGRFPDAKALAEADLDEIKTIIKSTGFFNAKATNIQRCAQALVERFGGEVPQTLEELTTLPGVGRKTANVVLGVAFGKPGWTVDTHVQRLVRRLGFTPETDPVKIEFALQEIFPKQDWTQYSITLIWHGRRLCFARKPNCPQCPINQLCPSAQI